MILMGTNPLFGLLEGVGPENINFFLGPNGTCFARCHCGAQRVFKKFDQQQIRKAGTEILMLFSELS
jgi:hypothetical protein